MVRAGVCGRAPIEVNAELGVVQLHRIHQKNCSLHPRYRRGLIEPQDRAMRPWPERLALASTIRSVSYEDIR